MPKSASNALSSRDYQLITAVISLNRPTAAKWDSIAKAANMTTAKYARDRWTMITNKMDPSKPGAGAAALSEKDLALFNAVVGNLTDIDWNAVAQASEHKTAKYARDRWWHIKKKIAAGGNGSNAGNDSGNDADETNEAGAADSVTVAKKPTAAVKGRKRKAAAETENTTSPPPATKKSKQAASSRKKAPSMERKDSLTPEPIAIKHKARTATPEID